MLLSNATDRFIRYAGGGGEYSPRYLPTVKSQFARINQFFGERKLETLTLEDWCSYLAYLRFEYEPRRLNGDKSSLSEATIDNHWKMIRSFYRWAHDTLSIKRVDLNLPRPKYQSPQAIPFSQKEVKRLLIASQSTWVQKQNGQRYKIRRSNADRDKAVILVLLDTGMRAGEMSRLRLEDIDLEKQEIYIRPYRDGRKSKARTVYIGNKTKQTLGRYIARIRSNPNKTLFNMAAVTVRFVIRRIGENAGIPNSHPHRFRHTFAITYLRNQGSVFALQKQLGHSTMDMSLKYLDIVLSDVANEHRRAGPVDNWL